MTSTETVARRRLVDGDARSSIESDLSDTLFVEAGAGSGKTTALVGRIVSLVRAGLAELPSIAAITFTEAAAAELRVRVREVLADAASGEVPGLDDTERDRCRAALSRIDEAAISTIHGFCQRILASHPIEAGLPPRIEVLDEIAESIEWRSRYPLELDELAADPDLAQLVTLAWGLGVSPKHIERLARELDDQWHLGRPVPPDAAAVVAEAERTATDGLRRLREALDTAVATSAWCTDEEDLLLSELGRLAELSSELRDTEHWQAAIPLVAASSIRSRGLGKAANWSRPVAEVRTLVAAAQTVQCELRARLFDLAVHALAHHFEARSAAAASERVRQGRLRFHDLLVLCRNVLRDDRGVLVDCRRRYRYVLIDEFQDTDPLQLEIAGLIGGAGDAAERSAVAGGGWEPGRCFFVGDPKQSIYRFRGADLGAYEAARSEIVGSGVTRLVSNFRSAPQIIDFVNGCFADLLGDRFQSLDAARDPHELAGARSPVVPVSVVGGALDASLRRRQQRVAESEDVCAAIELAVRTEKWPVFDPESGERPARFGDVAILVPRRTGLAELEAALDRHGIGYRVESASLILKSQDVRDVLALARALDEPGNHAAVVATLRSPAYSVGDDELVAWAQEGGSWSVEDGAVWPEAARRAAPLVAEALSDLARLRSLLGELGPVGTLSRAVRERRLLQLAADGPRARESWRRIRFVLDRARGFVEAGGGGLTDFADFIDDQVQGGLRSSESIVPDADEDVVRIMTVHGAKGLEFNITILCGFGTSDSTTVYDVVRRRPGGQSEVHFTMGLRTSGYKELDDAARALDAEEEVRLLYVAATRARDHLVVCGHHVKRNSAQSLGERLVDLAAALPNPPRPLPVGTGGEAPVDTGGEAPRAGAGGSESLRPGSGSEPERPLVASLEEYEHWCEQRDALLERARRPASVRATELSSLAGIGPSSDEGRDPDADDLAGGPAGGYEDTDPGSAEPLGAHAARRGRAGTQIGRAVHATLQTLSRADAVSLGRRPAPADTGAAERLAATAALQARSERVADRADEVSRLAAAALRSPVVRDGFASGTARRETYVSTRIGETILDGFVDLCFSEADGSLVVVDYKTDSVRNRAEAAERAAGYELQIAAYALALSDATGRDVSRCVLVFLAPPAEPLEHTLSGSALAQRMSTVRQIVGGQRR